MFGKLQLSLSSAEQLDQLIANHLDDLLPRSERFQDLLSKGPLLDALDKILCDFKMHIRVEQSIADLAGSFFNVAA